MITRRVQPHIVTLSNSPIPYWLHSPELQPGDEYQIDLVEEITGIQTVTATPNIQNPGNFIIKITLNNPNENLFVGDTLIIFQNNNYSDAKIIEIDDNIITLDHPFATPLTLYKGTRYSFPAIDNKQNGQIELSNITKNLTRSHFSTDYTPYNADMTHRYLNSIISRKTSFKWEFDDNHYMSGNRLGFVKHNQNINDYNSLMLSLRVGDRISVKQEKTSFDVKKVEQVDDELVLTLYDPIYINDYCLNEVAILEGFAFTDASFIITGYDENLKQIKVYSDTSYATQDGLTTATITYTIVPKYDSFYKVEQILFQGTDIIIVVDDSFLMNTPPVKGIIETSPSSKKTFIDTTNTFFNIFDGSWKTREGWHNEVFNDYVISNPMTQTNWLFSTNIKNNFLINRYSHSWLLLHSLFRFQYLADGEQIKYHFRLIDYDGITTVYEYPTTTDNNAYIPASLPQIQKLFNIPSIDDIKEYYISATLAYYLPVNSTLNQIESERLWFIVDTECTQYKTIDLIYKDSLGSYIPLTFQMKNRRYQETERDNYYTKEGEFYLEDGNYGYSESFVRGGETTYRTRSREQLTLNTGWVDQTRVQYFKELFQSDEVYLLDNNEFFKVLIEDTKLEEKQTINDNLINYTVKIRKSKNINRN